jgi:hypothetical protein
LVAVKAGRSQVLASDPDGSGLDQLDQIITAWPSSKEMVMAEKVILLFV